jgi:5S rRNA maturation endonuclease (ribonuclease M5)
MTVNLDKGGVWFCHACDFGGGIYDYEQQMFPKRSNDELWASISKITGAMPSSSTKHVPKGPVIATYQYVAPDGTLLFEKQRHEPKCFTLRAPNGTGGWRYSLDGVRKVLYRLPEVMTSHVVFIAEGEKDVESIRALNLVVNGYKITATCNFDGAGKWSDEYSRYFAGRRVAILPDNDEPGRRHAQALARSVVDFAESVKIVELPGLPEKGDVTDYLKDHTAHDLLKAVKAAPRYRAVEVKADDVPFFVSPSLILPDDAPQVDWLMPGAIHRGAKGLIVAPPKAGKSMIALDLAVSLSSGQVWMGMEPPRKVKIGVVSREDGPGMTMHRLEQVARGRGLDFQQLQGLYVNTFKQRGSFSIENDSDINDLCKWIKHEGIELCIFDVLNKLHAADENDNTKMTAVMARFDTVRVQTGCDVVVIHHDAKNSAPGSKKPRGASSIDSWWDWKLSVNVDPEDDSLKRVFFATKAGQPLNPIAVQFQSHPAMGFRIVPVSG